MKLTFNLRNAKAKKPTPINCFVHWEQRQVCIATGVSCSPSQWDKKRKRAKKGISNEATVNNRLVELEGIVGQTFAELSALGQDLTPDNVKQRIAVLSGRAERQIESDFFTTYETWITESQFTDGTKRNHRKAKNHVAKFAKSYGVKVSFERLDTLTWNAFVRFLLTVQQMSNDSGWNVVKTVKAFVGDCYEKGLHTNESFRQVSKARLVPKGEPNNEQTYLTEEELRVVLDLDLSDNPRLARVRDLFAFLSYSGMRYGDSQRLGPEHRKGNTLEFITGKNRRKATTPLLPEAARIWDMYEGRLPRISNQKGNVYLSEVLQLAGLDVSVTTVRFRGTERLEVVEPKWKAIGLHSAKRTFVSLSLGRGATIEELARVTGNTVATLQKYDVRTGTEAAENVRAVWQD